MQSALRLLYPTLCVSCGDPVEGAFGLCGACWGKTAFISGAVCDTCGVPLPGEVTGDRLTCDDCMTISRPWSRGRAALAYRDNARRLVLALKHGDRTDLVRPAALWMARALEPIRADRMLAVPVPAHWTRLVSRRYNQAALLARALARVTPLGYAPDLLVRPRRTAPQGHLGREQRFGAMRNAIIPHPRRGEKIEGRNILLIDDVMASGATLGAAAEACRAAGARDVFTLVLARAVKDA